MMRCGTLLLALLLMVHIIWCANRGEYCTSNNDCLSKNNVCFEGNATCQCMVGLEAESPSGNDCFECRNYLDCEEKHTGEDLECRHKICVSRTSQISTLQPKCGALDAPEHGEITGTGVEPGDSQTYTCNPGYVLDGSPATRTCGKSLTWSGTGSYSCIIAGKDAGEGDAGFDVNRIIIIAACVAAAIILIIVGVCTFVHCRKRLQLRMAEHIGRPKIAAPVQAENNEAKPLESTYYNTRAELRSSEMIPDTRAATSANGRQATATGQMQNNTEPIEMGTDHYTTIDDISVDIVPPSDEAVNLPVVVTKETTSLTELSTYMEPSGVDKEQFDTYLTFDDVSDDVVQPCDDAMKVRLAFAQKKTPSTMFPEGICLADIGNVYESLQTRNEQTSLYSSLD